MPVKRLHKILLCVLLLQLSMVSCDKSENPAGGGGTGSTSDANHFSCYVNGEYWEAHTDFIIGGPVALAGEYNQTEDYLTLQAIRRKPADSIYDGINFLVKSIDSVGKYQMSNKTGLLKGFINYMGVGCPYYFHDTLIPGLVKIGLLDFKNRVIKGTFAMDLKNTSCGSDSILHITNGTFTFNY